MLMSSMSERFLLATHNEDLWGRYGESFRKSFGQSFGSLWIPRAIPRKNGGFTIQLVLQPTSTNESPLVLSAHLLGESEVWPAYVEEKPDRVLVLRELGLIVPIFPFDPKLRKIKYWLSAEAKEAMGSLVGEETGVQLAGSEAQVDVLAYRLEKRCVLRFAWPGQATVFVKVLPRKKLQALDRTSVRVEDDGRSFRRVHFSGPRIFEIDFDREAYVMECFPGRSLHDLIEDRGYNDFCAKVGAKLQGVHTGSADSDTEYGVGQELKQLQNWQSILTRIGTLAPQPFEFALDVLRQDADGLSVVQSRSWIHRDFYDKQAICSEEGVGIIDFETSTVGDPAQDVGNFLAHQLLRGLQAPELEPLVSEGTRSFQVGYGETDESFKKRARWWYRSTALRLSALYSLRRRWRHLPEVLLEHV